MNEIDLLKFNGTDLRQFRAVDAAKMGSSTKKKKVLDDFRSWSTEYDVT